MSQTGLLQHRPAGSSNTLPVTLLAVLTAVVLAALGLFFAANSGTPAALVTGDFVILAASLLAGTSCGRAARRGGANARAWTFMAAAAFIWAAGMAVYAFYGLANN
ncbi:MAG: hybrid sensor histidine kinase/response regulator, partial [Pseudarthrobacter sp.]|nr:hybrid sensor histidine kinase/response regulator [Pseudarthrobacter sp.]